MNIGACESKRKHSYYTHRMASAPKDRNSKPQSRKKLDAQAFAKAVDSGATVKDALIAAGKSPRQALKGNKAVNREMKLAYRELVGKNYDQMVALGQSVTPETMRNAVLGRLVKGIADGSDKGSAITKLAGQWKELSMWQADSVAGIVIIQAAPTPRLADCPTMPSDVIEGEGHTK